MALMDADALVGLPFVQIPGSPDDHAVAGETYDGKKLRVAAVEQVWNDMLLMDALSGPGFYLRTAGQLQRACLEVAERLYGISASDAVARWVTLPKLRKACEWGKEAVS